MTSDKIVRALIATGLGTVLLYLSHRLYIDHKNGLPLMVWPVWWLIAFMGGIAYALRLTLFPGRNK